MNILIPPGWVGGREAGSPVHEGGTQPGGERGEVARVARPRIVLANILFLPKNEQKKMMSLVKNILHIILNFHCILKHGSQAKANGCTQGEHKDSQLCIFHLQVDQLQGR